MCHILSTYWGKAFLCLFEKCVNWEFLRPRGLPGSWTASCFGRKNFGLGVPNTFWCVSQSWSGRCLRTSLEGISSLSSSLLAGLWHCVFFLLRIRRVFLTLDAIDILCFIFIWMEIKLYLLSAINRMDIWYDKSCCCNLSLFFSFIWLNHSHYKEIYLPVSGPWVITITNFWLCVTHYLTLDGIYFAILVKIKNRLSVMFFNY